MSIAAWKQLATDQFDPWQVVPRQVFTPFDCLLISVAFVALCLGNQCNYVRVHFFLFSNIMFVSVLFYFLFYFIYLFIFVLFCNKWRPCKTGLSVYTW